MHLKSKMTPDKTLPMVSRIPDTDTREALSNNVIPLALAKEGKNMYTDFNAAEKRRPLKQKRRKGVFFKRDHSISLFLGASSFALSTGKQDAEIDIINPNIPVCFTRGTVCLSKFFFALSAFAKVRLKSMLDGCLSSVLSVFGKFPSFTSKDVCRAPFWPGDIFLVKGKIMKP